MWIQLAAEVVVAFELDPEPLEAAPADDVPLLPVFEPASVEPASVEPASVEPAEESREDDPAPRVDEDELRESVR